MKTFLLYVRKYDISINNTKLIVYKIETDSIYRIIGKMYSTSIEKIERIDYILWTKEKESFWNERGVTVHNYREPKLSYDF